MSDVSERANDYEEINYELYWEGKYMNIFNRQEQGIVRKSLQTSDDWFLDLGCGFGRMVPLYRPMYERTGKTILLDGAYNNLKLVNDKYPGNNFTLIAADAYRLPFRDGVIGSSLCIRLTQNLPGIEDFFTEYARIHKRGAIGILSYFNRRNLLRIFKFGRRCFNHVHSYEHKAQYGNMYGTHPRYMTRVLHDCGIRIARKSGSGFSYQISRENIVLQQLQEKFRLIRRIVSRCARFVDFVLSRFNLSLWQFLVLTNGDAACTRGNIDVRTDKLIDILRCPSCSSGELIDSGTGVTCSGCGRTYPRQGNIYDFRIA